MTNEKNNEDKISEGFDNLISNLISIEELREENKDIIKNLVELTDFKATAIRTAATALVKDKQQELDEKYNDVTNLLNMIRRNKVKKVADV